MREITYNLYRQGGDWVVARLYDGVPSAVIASEIGYGTIEDDIAAFDGDKPIHVSRIPLDTFANRFWKRVPLATLAIGDSVEELKADASLPPEYHEYTGV